MLQHSNDEQHIIVKFATKYILKTIQPLWFSKSFLVSYGSYNTYRNHTLNIHTYTDNTYIKTYTLTCIYVCVCISTC